MIGPVVRVARFVWKIIGPTVDGCSTRLVHLRPVYDLDRPAVKMRREL